MCTDFSYCQMELVEFQRAAKSKPNSLLLRGCQSVCQCVCQCTCFCSSVCLFVCLSVRLSVRLPAHPPARLCVCFLLLGTIHQLLSGSECDLPATGRTSSYSWWRYFVNSCADHFHLCLTSTLHAFMPRYVKRMTVFPFLKGRVIIML